MLVVAVVLAPRLKLDYVKFSYSEILTSDAAKELTKKVRDALSRLYGEYQKFESESFTSSLESFVVDVDGSSSSATTNTSCYDLRFGMVEVDAFVHLKCYSLWSCCWSAGSLE
ncbi:hypothetical protein MRB53_005746 [Persea americana]|uniref:Uncharacterized protein n=1 Tax=Persea americana TaxID=3435 RepID=A0ACC2MEQ5_PERAE|nr:hypothetical protein MRB53_005746 [Persea americana]